jgi:hypothetical protein
MLLHQFSKLCEDQHYSYLLNQGVFIADLKTEDSDLLLFQLNHYYIQVVFAKDTDNITAVKYFSDTNELDPFLETIDISDIWY